MQALGHYEGGRMLFLGLGTGLGSALIVDGVLEPMELAHLPYKRGRTYEDYVGMRGLKRLGKKKWRQHVFDVVKRLKAALEADYVVLGGGNAKALKKLSARRAPRRQRQRFPRRLSPVAGTRRKASTNAATSHTTGFSTGSAAVAWERFTKRKIYASAARSP
jgi:hypothetical protein